MMRKSRPKGARPFRDGAIDIQRWKARRRAQKIADRVGRRTLKLAVALLLALPVVAALIHARWATLSQCGLFVEALRCVGMLAALVIPCAAALIPIRFLTKVPAFIFRKLMHTVAFAAVTLLILKARRWQAASLTLALAAVAAFALLSALENERWFEHLLVQKTRGEVKRSLTAYFLMAAALTALCGYGFQRPRVAATAIMMWGTGDAAAALIGIPFGKHKVRWSDGKKTGSSRKPVGHPPHQSPSVTASPRGEAFQCQAFPLRGKVARRAG